MTTDNDTFKYWPGGLPKMKPVVPKNDLKDRRCPHCHGTGAKIACVKCMRTMCEDCISIYPSVGKVCGLCYDRMTEPQEDE